MNVTDLGQLGCTETPREVRQTPPTAVPPEWESWDDATRGAFIVGALSVQPRREQFAALGALLRGCDVSGIFKRRGRERHV